MDSSDYDDMRFYSEERVRSIADDIDRVVTIPVKSQQNGQHRVYSFDEAKQLLENAYQITVQDCGCKVEHQNCDAPRRVCLGLNDTAEALTKSSQYNVEVIDVDSALQVLCKSHDAGLVHLSYVMKGDEKPGLLCSCCPCCCHTLGSFVRKGVHAQILPSEFVTRIEHEKCIRCGTCMERCVFKAKEIKENRVQYDLSKCFGCGVCVSTCPEDAITLVAQTR